MNENTPPPEPPSGQGMDYSEIADVQDVHAAVQREKREPRVGREPLSIWLIAVYGLAVFFGGAYLGRYSGNFSGEALDPYGGEMPTMKKVTGPQGAEPAAELSPHDRGKEDFCGELPDVPSSERSRGGRAISAIGRFRIYNGGSRRPAMIVLKGLTGPVKVKGQQFGAAVMQPWDKTLTDQKIADVLTYERSEWGNNASPVTAEQIAALAQRAWPAILNSFTEHEHTRSSRRRSSRRRSDRGVHLPNQAKPQSRANHQSRKASEQFASRVRGVPGIGFSRRV